MGNLLRDFERKNTKAPRIAVFVGRVADNLVQPLHDLEHSVDGIDVFDARTANFDDNDPSWVSLFMDKAQAHKDQKHGRVHTPRQRQVEVMDDLREGRYDMAVIINAEAGTRLASRVLHSSLLLNALNTHTGRFLNPDTHPLKVMHISNITALRRSDRMNYDHFGPLYEPIGIAQRMMDMKNNGVNYFVDLGGHSYEGMYWAQQILGEHAAFSLSLYSALADTVLNNAAIHAHFAPYLDKKRINAHVFDGGGKWLKNGHYQRSIDLGLGFSLAMQGCGARHITHILKDLRHMSIAEMNTEYDLNNRWAIHDKQRLQSGKTQSEGLYWGNFQGALALGIDDVTATGGTQRNWALESIKAGAQAVLPVIEHGTSTAFKTGKEKDGFTHSLPWLMSLRHPSDPDQPLFPKIIMSGSVPWITNDHQNGFERLFEDYRMVDGTMVEEHVRQRCAQDIINVPIAPVICGFLRDIYAELSDKAATDDPLYNIDRLPPGYPNRLDPMAARFSQLVEGIEPITIPIGYDAERDYPGLDLANPARLPSKDIRLVRRP